MKTVSVIVPNYNHERFLEQRLQSIYAQSYKNFEVIILDDASIDNSKKIIEKYRSHPKTSKIVYNEVNSGSPFKQWAAGISNAVGDFIWIAESDDYCSPHFLSKVMIGFKDEDCVLSYAEVVHVDADGNLLESPVAKEPVMWDGIEFVKWRMVLGTSLVNVGMAVFRTKCLDQVQPNYREFVQCGDYQLHTDICLQGKVYACGEPLSFFRRHANAQTPKWLFTLVYYREIEMVFYGLFRLGIVNSRPIRQLLIDHSVMLVCTRKGMPEQEFAEFVNFWKGVARKYDFIYPDFFIWVRAKARNLHFFISKRLNG